MKPSAMNPTVKPTVMKPNMPRFPLTSLLLAAAWWLPSTAVAQDTVRLRNGSTVSGAVDAENYDALLFKEKKGKEEKPLRINWDDVTQISYAGATEYQQAVNQVTTGNLGAAIPKLQALAQSSALRKELKPLVQFQLASALQRSGKFAEAAAAQVELVKAFPKSRFVLPAARSIVECHIALNTATEGSKAMEEVVSTAEKGGVDTSFLSAFDFYRGRLMEAAGDRVGAKIKYQTAAAARGVPVSSTAMARLAIARCDQTDGQVDAARIAYKEITQLDAGNEVLAGAWNGLADITFAEAAKSRNLEKVTDALYQYLRGVVEYGPAPGEATEEYERALAGAAASFKQMSEIETDETKQKLYAGRAKARLDLLRKEFPNSTHLPK
jgi:hypothetical protein